MVRVVPLWRRSSFLTFLRFVHDRNPFYLLSALSMFIGFRIILGALNSAPGDWKTLLGLIVTLNVYEFAMIGLALFLITRRGLRRDGWILLGIEALFLVDLTNLNAELFTARPLLGAVVNALLLITAMVKILLVIRVLRLRVSTGRIVFIGVQLAFLLGLPGIFRLMRSSTASVSALQIYFVWWMVALLIITGVLLIQRVRPRQISPLSDLPWRLYVLLPMISLLVHLCGENRVYWVRFQPANVAPVLLAIVVAMNRSRVRWHPMALPASFGLVMVSILVSITPDVYQHDLYRVAAGVIISPLRIALVGSAGTMVFVAMIHYSTLAAAAAAVCVILAGLGADPEDIYYRLVRIGRYFADTSRRIVPDTAAQWGVAAIAGAFVLLGIGAVISLKAPPPPAALSEENIEPLV